MITKPKRRGSNRWLYQIFLLIDFVSLFVFFWRNIDHTLEISTLAVVEGYIFLVGIGLGLINLMKTEGGRDDHLPSRETENDVTHAPTDGS